MQKIALITPLIAILLMAACSQHTQEPTREMPTPSKRLYVLKDKLGLSVEQMEVLRPILEEKYQRKAPLMQELQDADDDEKKLVMQKIDDLEWEFFKKMTAHMTEEQIDKYVTLLLEEEPKPAEKLEEKPQRKQRGPRR